MWGVTFCAHSPLFVQIQLLESDKYTALANAAKLQRELEETNHIHESKGSVFKKAEVFFF